MGAAGWQLEMGGEKQEKHSFFGGSKEDYYKQEIAGGVWSRHF